MATTKDGRGWSLVFDDRTPKSEDSEELDQRTAIDDGSIRAQLASALDDPRLQNVEMTLPQDEESSRSLEMTVRIPPVSETLLDAPVADGHVPSLTANEADETRAFKQSDLLAMVRGMATAGPKPPEITVHAPRPAPAPVMLAPLPDRRPTIDDNEELKLFDDDDAPPLLDPDLLVEEKTRGGSRVRPIEPNDVRVLPAPVKPVDYTSFDIPPALALVLVPSTQVAAPTVLKVETPSTPAPPLTAPFVETIPEKPAERTPEKPRPSLPAATPLMMPPPAARSPSPPPGLFMPPAAFAPTPDGPEVRLADVLREAQEEKKAKKKTAAPSPRDLHADDFQRMSATTDTVARSIPLILVAFMVLSAILISVKMIRKDESPNQTHVELRFLPIGHHDGPIVMPSTKMQRIAVDTVPPGLLVLYNKEILGRTPFSVDLPVTLVEPLAAEVSSPYYEAWVGELKLNVEGEYRIVATLKAR